MIGAGQKLPSCFLGKLLGLFVSLKTMVDTRSKLTLVNSVSEEKGFRIPKRVAQQGQ